MDKRKIKELLAKHSSGTASEEEQNLLIKYYDLFENDPDLMELFSKNEKDALKKSINTNIWHNIAKTAITRAKPGILKPLYHKIAAAAVVCGICISAYMLLSKTDKVEKTMVTTNVKQEKGNRLIQLSDGSTIILQLGSKLNYPSSFDDLSKREVYLEGEAYFDIKHNPLKPFIIHTQKIQTTVLGTAFTIKAHPEDSAIFVTVNRGKVKVSDERKTLAVITPQQQIMYNKKKYVSVVTTLNKDVQFNWNEQDLVFEDITVADASKLLEEQFKVKIIFLDPLIKSNRFTTTFTKGESLEHLLESICEFNGAEYRYDELKRLIIIQENTKR